MIIIKMNGGLGNQLQQYALYEKLKSLGKEVKVDTSWFHTNQGKTSKRDLELEYFPKVSFQTCSAEEMQKILGNRGLLKKVSEKLKLTQKPIYVEHQMYDEQILQMNEKVLEGYWACEAYYADIIPLLQEKLEFPPSDNPKNKAMAEEMKQSNSVSIHIRRGDYMTEENQAMFGGICTEEYYKEAIAYIKENVPNARFFVFSDDSEYVREKYAGDEYTIVDINHGKDSFYDIYLMSQCKHNICANSTFSFWGARLNQNPGKKVIRPLKQKNCDWYVPEKMKQLWKGWILIDEEGKMVEAKR